MASSSTDLIQSILSVALDCSIDMISVNYVIKEEEPGSIIIYENHINPPSSKETHIRFDFVMNTLAERGYFILKVFQFATEYVRSRATDRTQFIPCCKITDIKYAECDKLIHLSKESPIWVELRPPLKVLEQLLVDDYYAKHRDEIVAHMLAEEKRDKIERWSYLIRYILTLALGSNANGPIINENYEVNEDGCRGILIHESRVNPPSQKIHSQFHTVMLNLAAQAYFRLHLENVILNEKSLVAYWVGDMDESECRNLVELSEVAPVWKELKQPLDSRSSPTPQVSSNIHATFSNPNRAARANSPRATPHKLPALEAEINEALMCPITQEIMTDPVICSDGYTYQRSAIEEWLKQHNTSPMTGLQLMLPVTLIPNRAIGDVIERMKGNHTAKFPQMQGCK